MTEINVSREFRIVFNPKDRTEFNGRRYFYVSAKQLHKYIGENNANTAILNALKSSDDKYTKKFRTRGTVYFYVK